MHVCKVLRCITRGRTVINAKIVHTRWFYSLIFSHMEYLLWGRYPAGVKLEKDHGIKPYEFYDSNPKSGL